MYFNQASHDNLTISDHLIAYMVFSARSLTLSHFLITIISNK